MKYHAAFFSVGLALVILLTLFSVYNARNSPSLSEQATQLVDTAEREVALKAVSVYQLEARDVFGVMRRLVIKERLSEVSRSDSTCDTIPPGQLSHPGLSSYRARITAYTVFGLRVGAIEFSCGGLTYVVQ